MAQNFRRFTSNDVGVAAATLFTANSYDTVVGISVANVTASAVTASVYINDGSNDIYLVKDAPIPSGSALQVLDGGAKVVVQSGDALKVVSSAASSLDVWISTVDDISSQDIHMAFIGRKPTNAPLTSDDIPNGIIGAEDLAAGLAKITFDTTPKTTGFTAVANTGYFCNTTSAAFTVTLPATPSAGDQVQLVDYAGTFNTNKLIIDGNGEDIEGSALNFQLTGEREGVILTYIDSTQGWIATSGINEGTDALEPQTFLADFLVAAGGGGAAGGQDTSRGGGGGGAGGYRTGSDFSITIGTSYTVTVGGGGTGGAALAGNSGGNNHTAGSNSVFSTITSAGGGRAGNKQSVAATAAGGSGGSGGGATATFSGGPAAGGVGNTPNTSPSQGNNGGSATDQSGGGGGGGSGGVGGNSTSGTGGTAGAGTSSSITGSSVTYAAGGSGGANSGGGNGANANANTGNGGTGGQGDLISSNISGGNGGSGIVIVKYPDTFTITNPGGGLTSSTSTAGGFSVTSFTAGTGTIQFN